MLSNDQLIDMLETEGSLEYLFLEHGVTVEELEDTHLATLIEEVLPTLTEIHLYIESVRKADGEEEA